MYDFQWEFIEFDFGHIESDVMAYARTYFSFQPYLILLLVYLTVGLLYLDQWEIVKWL